MRAGNVDLKRAQVAIVDANESARTQALSAVHILFAVDFGPGHPIPVDVLPKEALCSPDHPERTASVGSHLHRESAS